MVNYEIKTGQLNAESFFTKKKIIIASIAIVVILVVLIVVFSLKGNNTQAPVLDANLQTYTFTNSGGTKFRIGFFKEATLKSTLTSQTISSDTLVSPPLDGVSWSILVSGYKNDVKTDPLNLNTCYIPNSNKAGSVKVSSLGVSANICTDGGYYYYSSFGNAPSVYYLQILPYHKSFSLIDPGLPPKELNQVFPLSDVKQMIGSFEYLGQNK